MQQRRHVRPQEEADKPNYFFRFMCLAALTSAAAAAVYFTVNSSAAATASTAIAGTAKAAFVATAAAAASSSLVPLIALTLLVGSILLLPFLFRGNAYHVRPARDTIYVDSGRGSSLMFAPPYLHGHHGSWGLGSGQTVVVDSQRAHGHIDHSHSHSHGHGHGHDSHQSTHATTHVRRS